jgi:UDP-N-acetyl-D-mannosaminuronic acid dehydrogenase
MIAEQEERQVAVSTVCVVGLGYVGLPTALVLARAGHQVFGFDTSARVRNALAEGRAHVSEPGIQELLQTVRADGSFVPVDRPVEADVFILSVPTPIRGLAHKRADLQAVRSAASAIAPVVRRGNLVVLESTSPPGTTARVVAPILERESGLRAGVDIQLAHCPERVLPGRILTELVECDRVIGGIDRASAERARDLYGSFVRGEMHLTDATTAELVKLMENTHRDVNIALANEFALVAQHLEVDVWEAIDLANRHPRIKFLRPGPGVGGHCVAVDPWFVVGAAPGFTPLIAASRAVNDCMPLHVADLVGEVVDGLAGRTILALGLTYKADVDDIRESPSVEVIEHLRHAGAEVRTHDAMVASESSVEDLADGADCLLLLVDHTAYRYLEPAAIRSRMRRPIAVDTRNALSVGRWSGAGFSVVRLGDGRRAPAAQPV